MKIKKHLTPHDRFFRSMMTRPKIIKEFFENNLPVNIKSIINFDSIRPQKGSYIDDKLKMRITDLLYAAEFNHKPGYLYLLLEHQSTPDKLIAFRILKYMISIMDEHLKNNSNKNLPIIIPFVFYTGKKPHHSTDIFDLFEKDEKKLAQDFLYKPCQLIDLNKISDDELKSYLWYGFVGRIMKNIYADNFLPHLKELLQDMKNIVKNDEMDYIYTILTYIIEAGQVPSPEEFVETIKTSLSETDVNEAKIMTLAEHFRQEGKREGLTLAEQFRQEGKLEGLEEGEMNARKDVALKLLNQGMLENKVAQLTELPIDVIRQLKTPAH